MVGGKVKPVFFFFFMAFLNHYINPGIPTARLLVMDDISDITILVRLVIKAFGCK